MLPSVSRTENLGTSLLNDRALHALERARAIKAEIKLKTAFMFPRPKAANGKTLTAQLAI